MNREIKSDGSGTGVVVTPTSQILAGPGVIPGGPGDGWEESAATVFDRLDVSETTRSQYRREIRPFLKFMRHRGGTLTPTILLDWKRRLEKRTDIGTGTKKKYLNVARVLLRELHRWHPDRIPDLVTGVRGFRVEQSHKKNPITDDEIERVWKYLDAVSDLRLKTLFGLMYYQGLRRVEISRLLVEDFDAEEKSILVHGKGRDDKERISAHPRMVTLMQDYLEDGGLRSGPLFPSRKRPGKGLSPNMLWRLVMGVHKELGIRKNSHSWRKVFTSRLLASGMNLLEVRLFTRHRSVEMLQVYADRLDKDKMLPTFYAAFE